MKVVTLVCLLMVEAVGLMIGASIAGEMVSADNDMEVLAGSAIYIIMVFLIGATAIMVWKLGWKWYQKAAAKASDARNAMLMVALPLIAISLSGCFTKVEPGYVGIKVNQYGSQKGVEDFPIQTGRVWFNPFTEDVYKFPTFLQSVVWTMNPAEGSPNDDSITFNSIEGATVNTDIAISYSFDGEKVPSIFVEFRRDAEEITAVYMRSQVRDTFSRIASTMKVVEIFGEKKQELLRKVMEDLNDRLGPRGFHFDMVSLVGEMRVDERVQTSINAVIEATQRAIEAENKVRQVEAEARQAIAKADGEAQSILKKVEAQAKANELIAASITPEVVWWNAVEKWDGTPPQVIGGNASSLVNLLQK